MCIYVYHYQCFSCGFLFLSASIRPLLIEGGVMSRVYHCLKVWQSEVCVVESCFLLLTALCAEGKTPSWSMCECVL